MKTIFALLLGAYAAFSSPYAQGEEPVAIRAVTYNTWMIPFLRRDAKERANIIGRGLGEKGYDLVMLQEMFSGRFRKIVKKRFKQSKQGLITPRLPAIINSGLVTIADLPVVKKGFKRYEACGGWQCLSRKGIQFTRVELRKGSFLDVYNTHLQPFEYAHEIRADQLVEAQRFIEENSRHGYPVIFAGDFNIIGESQEYQSLRNMLPDFKDAWNELRPENPGYSWDPEENAYAKPDRGTSFVKQRVDYLFLRDGESYVWDIEGVELDFTRPLPYRGEKFYGSDHFAVGAQLRLIPNP